MRDGHLREGDILARRYILKQPVGAGGMSVIWRAWDSTLERTVAIKVLDGRVASDGGQRDRIRREARAAARIEHANAIGVYDYGETVTPRGRIAAYVVMQLLDGDSLASRLVDGPLPWPEAVAVAATVADVLHAAHRRGVVHRDVTPENVMLTTDGVKLLDFGIAADVGQREEAMAFGTPPYVAPERLVGSPASGSTDVYALGVLLFEMLTGAPPYPANTWEELEHALAAGRRPALAVPGLPASAAAACLRCLSFDPAERPSAAEVAAILGSDPGTPAGPGRRRRLTAVAVVVSMIALVPVVLLLRDDLPGAPEGSTPDGAAPAPSVSIVVTVAPPVIVQPSGSAPAGRSGGPASAPPSPPARPSASTSTAGSLSPQAAGQAVLDVVDRRHQTGEVRADVVEDIHNQVNNLISNSTDATRQVAALRHNLSDRLREQAISRAAYAEIDAAVVRLGEAFAP